MGLLTTAFVVILYKLWPKRTRKEKGKEIKQESEDIKNNSGIDAEFDQINLHLQDGLKSCIAQKVDTARRDILFKQKEMDDKIAKSKSDKEEELAIIESKYL